MPTLAPIATPTPSATSLTIRFGDSTLINYKGGRYRFTWHLPKPTCDTLRLAVAPTDGAATIPVVTSGSVRDGGFVEIDVPAGPAYLNGSWCGAGTTITVTRVS